MHLALKRSFVIRGVGFVLACALARDASAQLLSGLLQPVSNVLNTVTCGPSQLPSSSKLDAKLHDWVANGGGGSMRVIVSAKPGLLSTVRTLLGRLGTTLFGDLTGINAAVALIDVADLAALSCDLSVSSVSADAVVNVIERRGDSPVPPSSLRPVLGLPQDSPSGNGVGVAVIDSGIAPSFDFDVRISAFYDFTKGGLLPTVPSDGFGHGTHVAGLIGSSASRVAGAYQGLGPKVRLIGMKVLDSNGSGLTSDVVRAVEYATTHRALLGIQVINLSLGHPIYEPAARDPLVRAVEAASRQGIVVVAAAGNMGFNASTGQPGYGGILSPGNAPSAITVGALDTRGTEKRMDDTIARYSSRGPTWYDAFAKPDLVAPGHALVSNASSTSALYARYSTARVEPEYLRLSGTSMASAVTSGAVALMLQANKLAHPTAPSLTPNAVKAILQYTAIRMRDLQWVEYDHLTQGSGALNVLAAIDLARLVNPARPVRSIWSTPTAPTSTKGDESWDWSQHIVWGTHIIWGNSIGTNEEAWSTATTWGAPTTWQTPITIGEDVVWDFNDATWSSQSVWGPTTVGTFDDSDHIIWGTTDNPDTTVWGSLAQSQVGPD
jgi:serine protease AprX